MQITFRSFLTILILFSLLAGCSSPALNGLFSPADQLQSRWWQGQAFYEIFVRSFYDSNGDGIGDFNGIIQKLDYLNDGDPQTTTDLGVTGIWLMPIFPSPSYHGYDVTDYFNVNPDYGTLDDFKRLIDQAHQRGIHIVIDMVLNHTSNEHPWFVAAQDPNSPYRDWYIWNANPPKVKGPWGQPQVWYQNDQDDWYYAVFTKEMPDLNYHNVAVVKEVEKITNFWMKDVKVDGFRLDGARYLVEEGNQLADTRANHQFFKQLRAWATEARPNSLLLGEVWTDTNVVAEYTQGDELDLVFDFDLAEAFLNSARSGQAKFALGQLNASLESYAPGTFAPFLANHDMDRIFYQLSVDEMRNRVAASMLLTAPNTPFTYYGEEIGMMGKKPDPTIRTPMQWSGEANGGFTTGKPWIKVNKEAATKNVAAQVNDPASLLAHYRSLIQLRDVTQALQTGETRILAADNQQIYALMRWTDEQKVLVLINLGAKPVSTPKLSLAEGQLKGTYKVSPLFGEGQFSDLTANPSGGFDDYIPLPELPPYTTLVLELK